MCDQYKFSLLKMHRATFYVALHKINIDTKDDIKRPALKGSCFYWQNLSSHFSENWKTAHVCARSTFFPVRFELCWSRSCLYKWLHQGIITKEGKIRKTQNGCLPCAALFFGAFREVKLSVQSTTTIVVQHAQYRLLRQ